MIYIDRSGRQLTREEHREKLADPDYRYVVLTSIEPVEVVTTWIGECWSTDEANLRDPVFQTYVHLRDQPVWSHLELLRPLQGRAKWNWDTEAEAIQGHELLCAVLRGELPFDWFQAFVRRSVAA